MYDLKLHADVRGSSVLPTPAFTVAPAASCISLASRYRSFHEERAQISKGRKDEELGSSEGPGDANNKHEDRVQSLCKTLLFDSAKSAIS